MPSHESTYVPALSHDWLTPFYDTLIRWTMPEDTFKRELIRQAGIKSRERILDLGCGTATLTLLIKEQHPDATVVGIDGDEKIVQIGSRKIKKAGLGITLTQAMAFALPYPDDPFDRVLSSLMFHHLTRENKLSSFKEIYRVLRNGGELHIADFGKPHNLLMKIISLPWRLFGGSSGADNLQGLLPGMMRESGFIDVRESTRYMTVFGTLSLYAGRKR
jgi:ubiquinone/menaquinone biosynthesis C-methylase UbiE